MKVQAFLLLVVIGLAEGGPPDDTTIEDLESRGSDNDCLELPHPNMASDCLTTLYKFYHEFMDGWKECKSYDFDTSPYTDHCK